MKMSVILLCVVAVFAAVVISQTPVAPVISETFDARVTIEVRVNRTYVRYGRGVELRNQPKGESLLQYVFEEDHRELNEFVLERYDLGAIYTIVNEDTCTKATIATNETLPLFWAWLKVASLVRKEMIDERTYDIWEATIGYATMGVAVPNDYPSRPHAYWRHSPQRNVTVVFDAFNPIVPDARYFNVPRLCDNATVVGEETRPASPSACVERATMIARAKVWADANIPYNQDATHDGYREDCSGFVSMAWGLEKPGRTTFTLGAVSDAVAKASLKEGDILLDASEHVVLFGGWTNSAQTEYTAYEETRPGEGTVKRATPYPYWYNTAAFKPYKYKEVCA